MSPAQGSARKASLPTSVRRLDKQTHRAESSGAAGLLQCLRNGLGLCVLWKDDFLPYLLKPQINILQGWCFAWEGNAISKYQRGFHSPI